jgi:dCMP deaminase
MKDRISKEEYFLQMAETAAQRSEDPYLKVGAVASTVEGRIIATGYNGLTPGFVASDKFWENRNARRKMIIHAEQNLCSLFSRGEAWLVAATLSPCSACLMTLIAHGVERIIFRDYYERDQEAELIAKAYDIAYVQIKKEI